ncbi:hypothetical protein Fmac_013918 [Flemingia macrophylla]|uniref:Uncharacterized protein n=1 Tax=Flemingia macrophylla TaxID=520843 RepID=A0ABD1MC88_9FABA
MKDREIEDLNSKLAQLVASNESLQASEVQLKKDRNVEIVIDKMISSLASVVTQEQVLDDSISGKIVYIEEGTAHLIEKYNQILSDIYQLGQSFCEVGLDTKGPEYGNILTDARGGLLELKKKETELVEKLAQLEDENRKLVDDLDKERAMIGTLNTELGNLKTELQQEKVKFTNTKEKLSMAVTKGKALVQQRDSLKTSLADKSSELEKCLIELQEKSVALQAAELVKEELAQREDMVGSLQNSLEEKNAILDQVEEILSLAKPDENEMVDVPERLSWLVDERNTLKDAFLELCNLKEALSLVDLPEPVSSSDLESQMNWLMDSFLRTRDDMHTLQEQISTIKEESHKYIDQLSVSLLLELQEKNYLLSELNDLRFEYDELLGKNNHISLEKDQIVNTLVNLCGLNMESEGFDQISSSTSTVTDLCFQMIKEQSGPLTSGSPIDAELFDRIQSLLYVRDQGLMLYEDILEEEMLIRADVSKLSNELKVASEEIIALKEERGSLLQDVERSEEKIAMLRDKLSMAVKKGKGLVQDRDNLKGLLNEKNSEIEQLKVDLQKHESTVSEYREEINRLSSDVESIPKLEADFLEMKRGRNQFEQFLMESNNMLQKVMECIDGIILPVDPVFDEPIEKVKWFASYVSECQDAKVHVEQELQLVKEKIGVLEIKLAEAHATIQSLEQELSSSDNKVSQLAEEKTELEREKENIEEELNKVKEKVAEVCSTTKSLEDALSQAEKDISILSGEKEQVQLSRVAAEQELESVKDEAVKQTSKLAEASRTIKDLEDKLSQVEDNVNLLTEKYHADQVVKIDMENELKKLQDETVNQDSKLAGASATIKSLEDALSKAQDDISALESANKIAEQEISSLGFKLNSCLDELAGKNGSLENRSLQLIGLLNDLQEFMKDTTIFPRIKQCFESKYETLKNMNLILNKITDNVALTANDSKEELVMEENPLARKTFLDGLENFEIELDNREIEGADIDTIISLFGNIVKGFRFRDKHIADKFDEFSDSMDEFSSHLHEKLLETETISTTVVGQMEIMKEKTNKLEKLKEDQENIIATLENDVNVLLSACIDSTVALQTEVDKNLGQPGSISEVEKLNLDAGAQAENHKNSKHVEVTQKLMNASRKVQTLITEFRCRSEQVDATTEDLQNKLKETIDAFELVTDERDLNKNRVLQLESDIPSLQNACSELKDKLEGYCVLEEKLEEKEAEVSSMHKAFKLATDERDLNKNRVLQLESDIQSLQNACSELKDKLEGYRVLEEKLEEKEAEVSSMHKAFELVTDERDLTKNRVLQLQSTCSELKDKLEGYHVLEEKLKEKEAEISSMHNAFELVTDERDLNKNRVLQLESDIQSLRNACSELKDKSQDYHALEKKLEEKEAEISSMHNAFELVTDERDLNKNRVLQLESDIQSLRNACSELKDKSEDYHALEKKLEEKEAEISSMHNVLLAKEESFLVPASQMRDLFDKIDRTKIPIVESEEDDLEPNTSAPMKKLFYIIDSVTRLHNQMNSLSPDKEKLQSILETKDLEILDLKEEVKQLNRNCEDSTMIKNELSELTYVLEKIMDILGASEWAIDRKSKGVKELMPALEKHIIAILSESENSKSKALELDIKLVGSQKIIDELRTKVKLLEDSLQERTSQPDTVQERSIYETSSLPSGSEITEVEEGSLGKKPISPVSLAAHVRNMRKGSTDHLALDISVESDNLLNRADKDEDKGHVFKSLNTSGFVPKQGKLFADRIDGLWVSGGRVLMSRPRARLGLIGYVLILHMWLLGTIL